MGPHSGDPATEELDLSCARADLAGDDIDQGRLPRAVRPDQPDDLAATHRQSDTVECPHSAEAVNQPRDLEEHIRGAAHATMLSARRHGLGKSVAKITA